MPKDTVLRQRVADLIRESKTTQAELAGRAGVPQSLLSSIVTGARADLRADSVTRIARACGLSPTALGRLLYDAHPEKISAENSGS